MIPGLSFGASSVSADLTAVKRMAGEAHENLRRMYAWLQPYDEQRITDAAGRQMYVLARNVQSAAENRRLFAVTSVSATRARVNEGIVMTPKYQNSGSDDMLTALAKRGIRIRVPGKEVDIAPGRVIYVKPTYEEFSYFPEGALPDTDKVDFAGGTVTGGVGGKGGTGGYGGGGGGGGQGGGGGGGGGPSGDGSPGNSGDAGGDAVGSTGGVGGDATGAGIDGDNGNGGAGSEEVNNGGNGGQGGTGGAGAAGEEGADAPAYGETGGPTQVVIPAFSAYRNARAEVFIQVCTSAEIVCVAEVDDEAEDYWPIAEIGGTPEAPTIHPLHEAALITAPITIRVEISPS